MSDDPAAPDPEQVYVLRLSAETDQPDSRRLSLYDASRGERVYFRTPGALLRWLGARLDPHPPTTDRPHLKS